jgi:hypothetical protein
MMSSIFGRRVLDLWASYIVLVTCFLFSGCDLDKWMHPGKDAQTDIQRAALLIIVNANDVKDGKVDFMVNTEKIDIAGNRLSDWLDKAKSWRINLFRDGNRIVGDDEFITKKTIPLPGAPVNKLLRADLDIHLSGTLGKDDAKFRTETFMILFHQYPDAS